MIQRAEILRISLYMLVFLTCGLAVGFFANPWLQAAMRSRQLQAALSKHQLRNHQPPGDQQGEASRDSIRDGIDYSIPSPEFSPNDVVRLQVQSLRDSGIEPQKMVVCYSLASPSNRFVTGPFERFSAMTRSFSFVQLVEAEQYQVGEAFVQGDTANVLVSVFDSDKGPHAYRFLLSKQKMEPYENCWMTDAVEPLRLVSFDELEQIAPSTEGDALSSEGVSD